MPDSKALVQTFLSEREIDDSKFANLECYVELLAKWNQSINLIGKTTEADIWERHILDSVQLIDHLPEDVNLIVDVGSGAGFPGLVFAVLGLAEVHMVESVAKKANFMKQVILDTNANAKVHNERVETLKNLKPDVISARAFAPLSRIFSLTNTLYSEECLYILLKGATFSAEVDEAYANGWAFHHNITPSIVDSGNNGVVVTINNVSHQASN